VSSVCQVIFDLDVLELANLALLWLHPIANRRLAFPEVRLEHPSNVRYYTGSICYDSNL